MEAHYYRHEYIDRKSKNIPEEERSVKKDVYAGETLKVKSAEEFIKAISSIMEAGVNDGYVISSVDISLRKENKRRTKRQLIAIYNWY